jgi:replication factor C subunit 2/4
MTSLKKTTTTNAALLPWTSKYRPASLEQMRSQAFAVDTLRHSLAQGNLPHLLFHGPPGTGKTSLSMATINEMYPKQSGETANAWRERLKESVLELNASDERGIDTVRSKIKEFAKLAPVMFQSNNDCGSRPLKIIVLDEADQMTMPAQSALRRIMEEYSATTRFFIICNVVTRILPAIASRCLKFRFRPIADDLMFDRLLSICKSEHLEFALCRQPTDAIPVDGEPKDNSPLHAIVTVASGDMRKAITCLQGVALLADSQSGEAITQNDIYDAVGDVPPSVAETLLTVCANGKFDDVLQQVEQIISSAYNVNLVLERLSGAITVANFLTDLQKVDAVCKVACVDDTLKRDGADGFVQLLDVATCIWQLLL